MKDHFEFTTSSVRALIEQTDRARSDAFEIRNRLASGNQRLRDQQGDWGPAIPLGLADLIRAGEAAEKAAEQACKEAALTHRNLMTLLGYVEAESKAVRVDPDGPKLCPNGHTLVDSRVLAFRTLADQVDTYSFYSCGSTHTETRSREGHGATGDWSLTNFCKNDPRRDD